MTWRFDQRTGEVSRDGIFFVRGYAGQPPEGKNNPAMESVHDIGPLPRGLWQMVAIMDHASLGKNVIRLVPAPTTITYGRGSFYWHGDSLTRPGFASHGCIVAGGAAQRLLAWQTGDHALEVVAT